MLDVEDMKREGVKLGQHVTIQPIEGGIHDLSLSDSDAQMRVFNAVSAWLQSCVESINAAATAPRPSESR